MRELGLERAAVIVVDMQNGFCHESGSMARMGEDVRMCADAIAGCRRLVDAAHDAGVPVLYIRAEHRLDFTDGGIIFNEMLPDLKTYQALVEGTWDAEIVDELTPLPSDYVIHKNRFSAFYGTKLDSLLTSMRIETVVVCGVTTSICVESTVRDAAQRDYRCFVARDAVGEPDAVVHDAALAVMASAFAYITTVDQVVDDWSARRTAAATGNRERGWYEQFGG